MRYRNSRAFESFPRKTISTDLFFLFCFVTDYIFHIAHDIPRISYGYLLDIAISREYSVDTYFLNIYTFADSHVHRIMQKSLNRKNRAYIRYLCIILSRSVCVAINFLLEIIRSHGLFIECCDLLILDYEFFFNNAIYTKSRVKTYSYFFLENWVPLSLSLQFINCY